MQFYVPDNGLEATRLDISNAPPPSHIDMLHYPVQGQLAIENVYQQTGISQKPDRFQVILRVYSTDMNQSIVQGLPQWHIIHTRFTGNFGEHPSHCICSQVIERLYFVQNSLNGNILLIGHECIKKFGSESLIAESSIIGKFYRKCQHCSKSTFFTDIIGGCCPNCTIYAENTKRCCRSCLKLSKIAENNWRCKSCIQNSKPAIIIYQFRKTCRRCQKIFHTDAEFKDTCLECYQARSKEKIPLNVPFDQKERAKSEFGARWEPSIRKWWVPGDANFAAIPPEWLIRT